MVYTGQVNGPSYIKIIQDVLFNFVEDAFRQTNTDWIFMQDNARAHKSKFPMKWFKDNNICLLSWSLSSPERHPIENVWDYNQRKLKIYGAV